MRKIERRAILCIMIAIFLAVGMGVYIYRYIDKGDEWATFYANQHIYHDGNLNVGKIHDRTGKYLAKNSKKGVVYNDDYLIRVSTAHAVGDAMGHVATGAQYAFRSRLVGYNLIEGTYSISSSGRDLYLTVDSDANVVAYDALADYKGTVGVYNYKTGEIICMVSKPTYDPSNNEDVPDGAYINKFLSSRMTPGSVFKLLTTAAAIDNIDNIEDWSYDCEGVDYIKGEKVTCMHSTAHGHQNIYEALANSCNCAYANLALKIGGEKLSEYTDKVGLTKSYDIDGIENMKGRFTFPEEKNVSLGWAGVGQFEDEINPCSMMVYMGAIANEGKAAVPYLIKSVKLENAFDLTMGSTTMTDELLSVNTANKVKDMMKNNVEETYGSANFPGLDIYAKSGTAERGDGKSNTWFTGFIKDEKHPYAFIVCAEEGETGAETAAPIANTVLQEIVRADNSEDTK